MKLIAAVLLSGAASVIDGDTLEIHGRRVRLAGIDAAEASQLCTCSDGPWRCGAVAANALSERLSDRVVTCHLLSTDRYQRAVAACTLDGESLNHWLVRAGWAVDYPQYSKGAFAEAEAAAAADQRGMWRCEFDRPNYWRKLRRASGR